MEMPAARLNFPRAVSEVAHVHEPCQPWRPKSVLTTRAPCSDPSSPSTSIPRPRGQSRRSSPLPLACAEHLLGGRGRARSALSGPRGGSARAHFTDQEPQSETTQASPRSQGQRWSGPGLELRSLSPKLDGSPMKPGRLWVFPGRAHTPRGLLSTCLQAKRSGFTVPGLDIHPAADAGPGTSGTLTCCRGHGCFTRLSRDLTVPFPPRWASDKHSEQLLLLLPLRGRDWGCCPV